MGLCKVLVAVALLPSASFAQTVTIAALGDSLTAGYGLPQADGFVPQMQAWLDDQGADVRMINAGVSGDTTAGGLSRVDWMLTPDVDAMIVALGGNDYLRGIDPVASRENLDQILEIASGKGVDLLLVGIAAGNNYGQDYQQAFNGMYAELAQGYDIPLITSFFDGITDTATTQLDIRKYMQADGIHPNAQGVALIVDAMGPAIAQFAQAARE